jgi:GDP-L-fucose synthase
MQESALLTGLLESTNEPYAIAKIAGIKLCESYNRQYGTDYRSAMPTNLYGPNDNFHLENSHVIPAMIRKFHDAKTSNAASVTLWGTGTAKREFLHVDDMAAACLHIMGLSKERFQSCTQPMLSHLNVGTGEDVTIRELAEIIRQVVGYQGEIAWDSSKPDGTPRKLMDVSKVKSLGWQPQITLVEGLASTYRWFVEHQGQFKAQ